MWEPSEKEMEDCENGIACSYGICSECILGGGKECEEDEI